MKAMTAVLFSSENSFHERGSALSAGVYRLVETVSTWRRRSRSRRQLSLLDDRQMKDIGIGDAQRFIEVNKPFWEE